MRESRGQFVNALLLVVTAAVVISAFINFQQNFQEGKRFRLPDDGVTWVDRTTDTGQNVVIALNVEHRSSADRVGIRPGDRLVAIETVPIEKAIDVAAVLASIHAWNPATYTVQRRSFEFKPKLIIGERVPDFTLGYQYMVGLVYLAIGLFVHFRRGNAYKSLHFLVLCLVSFILSTFHSTGKLNSFDQVMYWGNFAAGFLPPRYSCISVPPSRWRGLGCARVGAFSLCTCPPLCLRV